MAKQKRGAVVGVSDHCGWAVLVTMGADGAFLDRRRVDLVEPGLSKLPHHAEGQRLPLEEAVELVLRVTASSQVCATQVLDALAADVSAEVVAIALRRCPPLPPTIAERLTDYRAQNVADSVLSRQALAAAAEDRRWAVQWYDPKTVFALADAVVPDEIASHLTQMGKRLGSPWRKDHKQAAAAALAATGA